MEETALRLELSRKHYTRLRHYWQGRDVGAGSGTDTIDLDLAAAELIRRSESRYYGVTYIITPAGEKALAAEKAREIERRKPHHELAGRLAAWLRSQGRVTWENIELLVIHENGSRQAIRPDVFTVAATYDEKRINPAVYEIKVSRADFFADIKKPEKRLGYSLISEVTYYVAPNGLIDPSEIPVECGLVVEVLGEEFKVLKRPKKRRVMLTAHHFMNLILKSGSLNYY